MMNLFFAFVLFHLARPIASVIGLLLAVALLAAIS